MSEGDTKRWKASALTNTELSLHVRDLIRHAENHDELSIAIREMFRTRRARPKESAGISSAPARVVRVRPTKDGYAIVHGPVQSCQHCKVAPKKFPCGCPFDCWCRKNVCPSIAPPAGLVVVFAQADDT